MKKIFFVAIMFVATLSVKAGNGTDGNGNCGCNDKTDIYAAGKAEWVSSMQIRCKGEDGTCWKLEYNGGWVLTIYLETPVVFGNGNSQGNPPAGPEVSQRGDGFTIYDYSSDIWTRK